jgi:hypothetical protein
MSLTSIFKHRSCQMPSEVCGKNRYKRSSDREKYADTDDEVTE